MKWEYGTIYAANHPPDGLSLPALAGNITLTVEYHERSNALNKDLYEGVVDLRVEYMEYEGSRRIESEVVDRDMVCLQLEVMDCRNLAKALLLFADEVEDYNNPRRALAKSETK